MYVRTGGAEAATARLPEVFVKSHCIERTADCMAVPAHHVGIIIQVCVNNHACESETHYAIESGNRLLDPELQFVKIWTVLVG